MKRHLILIAIAFLLALAVLVAFPGKADRLVKGKTVHAWILAASDRDPQAVGVLRDLGTNARPEFVRSLTRQDSAVHKLLWNLRKKIDPRLRRAARLEPPLAWDERARAARALGAIGPESAWALPYLAQALQDRYNGVSESAATAMGQIGKASVPYLIRSITEDPSHRRSVLNALAQVGPDAEIAVPAVVECLSDGDEFVRSRADYALRAIGAPWIKRLDEAILHGPSDARIAAAKELSLIYPPSVQTAKSLLSMMNDPSAAARRQAAESLGIIRPYHSQTVPVLIRALSDESVQVREAAATALGRLGLRASPSLASLTNSLADSDERVRLAAKESIARIESAPPAAR